MASGTTNWVHEKGVVTEKDRIALERAKRMESKAKRKGWLWVKINERNKIFVPCDKESNPTKDGLERIKIFKEHLGIK